MERLACRAKGCDRAGSTKGTSNTVVQSRMADIRAAADLQQLAASKTPIPVSARLVREAANRLAVAKLVPHSAVPSEEHVGAALSLLRSHSSCTNQQLWKLLASHGRQSLHIKPFADFTTRVWLLSPPESVVESMASAIGEVFGEHRQLNHKNAAQELVVRWNGPSLCRAGRLLKDVQQTLTRQDSFRCVRRGTSIGQSMEGTVISRHKTARDQKACLWQK